MAQVTSGEKRSMICPVCRAERRLWFKAQVLCRYEAEFFFCQKCGFLGAGEPHWIGEAYRSAIAAMDTGIVARNRALASQCIPILYLLLKGDRSEAKCLDFAGGTGLFTRLMRDAGYDFYWSDKYAENVFARGFEYSRSTGPAEVVTAFEVIEHAPDPIELIQEVQKLAPGCTLLFTTVLYQNLPPAPDKWWYYAFQTGQHVSFFQRRTLEHMARRLGRRFSSHHGVHAFSEEGVAGRLWLGGGSLRGLLGAWVRRRLGSRTFCDFETVRAGLGDDVFD